MQVHHVILALGSNTDSGTSFSRAIPLIEDVVNITGRTRILTTEPEGIVSPQFVNAMIKGTTPLSLKELQEYTKRVELQCGRRPGDKEKGIIKMDIDILEFDGERYHDEDWSKKHIRQLLAELPDND